MGCSTIEIVRTVLIGVTSLIAGSALILPFWFTFEVQIQYNTEVYVPVKYNMGLFWMTKGENIGAEDLVDMVDLVFVDKASNAQTFPPLFRVAQIFYAIGDTGLGICFVASMIYMFRKYKTATGEMCLAGALLPSALSLVLGVVFAALNTVIDDKNSWEAFPVPSSYVQVKAEPTIEMSYGLYVAAVAALLALVSLGVSWMHACVMCQHVEKVRYQMLFAPLTEDERGVGSESTFHFRPNPGFQPKPGFQSKPGFRYDGDSRPAEVNF